MTDLIHLNDSDFFAKGSHNLVYRHPTEPECLIKLLGIVKVLALIKTDKPVRGLAERLANSWWLGNNPLVRRMNRFRISKANVREFMEVVRVRLYDEFLVQPPPFMQCVRGFVDTNLGLGMLVVAERDRAGNYAPTLASLIKERQIDATLFANLNTFFQQILRYDCIISDLHPDNIVYAYKPTHGEHFVIIDGVGDKNVLPWLRWSHYLRQRRKRRIIQRLQARVAAVYP